MYFVILCSAFGDRYNPQFYILGAKTDCQTIERVEDSSATDEENVFFKLKYKFISVDKKFSENTKSIEIDYIKSSILKRTK